MRLCTARHPLVSTYLAMLALILVLGLIYAGLMARAALASPRGVQVFIMADARAPDRVIVGLNMNVWLPPMRTFANEPMICDGIQLHAGRIPYTGFSGYYGELPANPPGGAHHCVFHDWRAAIALDIPAALPAFPRAHLSLQDDAALPLNQPLRITYQSQSEHDGALYEARATDAFGHWALASSGGYGPNGGHIEFHPVGARGLQPGHGSILFTSPASSTYLRQSGWGTINLMVSSGISVPVVWT